MESADRLPIGRLNRNLMTYLFAHGGKGECGIRMVWDQQDFRNNWGFLAHVLLPAGVSIDYHRHDLMEETYVVINGSGRITVDDETEVVYEGAVIPNRIGGSHGIYNHTQDDLEMLVVAVCLEQGKLDTVDLDDDLTEQ
jgi:mannose-6-phosphate isomerase-like protein (cupin superfamily)